MKKEEYVRIFCLSLESMYSSVGDNTNITKMFGENDLITAQSLEKFLLSPFLVNYKNIYNGFYTKDGSQINLDNFVKQASKNLLIWFDNKNYKTHSTFGSFFNYDKLEKTYFKEISLIIVNTLEEFGKPPLFHKRADKILRYDWEK